MPLYFFNKNFIFDLYASREGRKKRQDKETGKSTLVSQTNQIQKVKDDPFILTSKQFSNTFNWIYTNDFSGEENCNYFYVRRN